LDPTENFLIASNQNSSNLVLFARNTETGKLILLQKDIMVPNPVCVKF
jgi:6-phosphogluconolactonase